MLDPANGHVETIWRGGEGLSAGLWGTNLSVARDGKTSAVIRNSFAAAPEVWAGPIGEWKQMTHRNAGVKPAWGEAKSIHWKNDGYDIQGWLIYLLSGLSKEFRPDVFLAANSGSELSALLRRASA